MAAVAQYFGLILKLVSAHFDQNKAGLEKQAKIQNMSIKLRFVYVNVNVRKT